MNLPGAPDGEVEPLAAQPSVEPSAPTQPSAPAQPQVKPAAPAEPSRPRVSWRTLDEVFGDVLPTVTSDELADRAEGADRDTDRWYRDNRPPHHG